MHFNSGGGRVVAVHDLKSALTALIVELGEGAVRDGERTSSIPTETRSPGSIASWN
ncbi:hypothetical protein AB0I35_11200 [Nocardia sp. NPDC050378]|uniref:hypothetical protein n=1 Tax=Nocardia sp. NPDC050378 TaxID=3155400 RepID=UPI0033D8D098